MGLAVAIQMDPIDTINIDADSTFALALDGQRRGHALFHYLPQALTLRHGRLFARGRRLEVFRRRGNHRTFFNCHRNGVLFSVDHKIRRYAKRQVEIRDRIFNEFVVQFLQVFIRIPITFDHGNGRCRI